jgi:hypothetical protein
MRRRVQVRGDPFVTALDVGTDRIGANGSAVLEISISRGGIHVPGSLDRVGIPRESAAIHLARILNDLPAGKVEQWWTCATFRGDYRDSDNWEGAVGVPLDWDFYPAGYVSVPGVKRPALPETFADRLMIAVENGEVAGNVFHLTPRGCRVVVLFPSVVTDRVGRLELAAAAALLVGESLTRLGFAEGPDGGLREDAPKTQDCAAAMFCPRATVDGVARDGDAIVLRVEPYTFDELRAVRDRTVPETRATVDPMNRGPSPHVNGSSPSPVVADAVARFNAANPLDVPRSGGQCPACGHRECFGQLDDVPDRWSCFSANHASDSGGCGLQGSTCWHGDALDIAARRAGRGRVEHLRATGYLVAATAASDSAESLGSVYSGTEILAALRTGAIVERSVVIDGVMRERDLLILFGPPGMGKSQLGLALGAALALGPGVCLHVIADDVSPQWRVRHGGPRRVLYWSAEDEEVDVARRLCGCLAARKLPEDLPNLRIVTPGVDARNLNSAIGRKYLEDNVREFKPDDVIIDNLTATVLGLHKEDEGEVSAWIAAVPRYLRDTYGVSVVLLGHASKGTANGDARSALDKLFGSMAWGAAADGAVMLDWVPGEPHQRRLIHAKARGFAPFRTVRLAAAKGDCVFPIIGDEDDQADTKSNGPRPKVGVADFRRALEPAGQKRREGELLLALDITDSTFRKHLKSWREILGAELGSIEGKRGHPAEFWLVPDASGGA